MDVPHFNSYTVGTVPKTELLFQSNTPNGDEHNELFLIQGLNIVDYTTKFLRWEKWYLKVIL